MCEQKEFGENESAEKQWKNVYTLGGITTLIVILGTIIDIIIGNILGGDLTALPKTAIDRFTQFQGNWLLGLYNLDLLNISTSIIMLPTFFALFAAHRRVNIAYAMFAMMLCVIGTSIFVANNTALPMLELSQKYAASTTETQKTLLAAAGEALIVRGSHGSPGVFLGFALTIIAEIIMSFVMLTGKIFSKVTSYMGILGSVLLLIYIILVTFIPETKNMAMIFVTPGGLLALAWMIMFTIRLFQLGRTQKQ